MQTPPWKTSDRSLPHCVSPTANMDMSYFTIKYLATLPLGLSNDSNRIVKVKSERCETTADEM